THLRPGILLASLTTSVWERQFNSPDPMAEVVLRSLKEIFLIFMSPPPPLRTGVEATLVALTLMIKNLSWLRLFTST
ncbi:hypothetical protein TNCV_1205891, partial [Trichonephila clavipes]